MVIGKGLIGSAFKEYDNNDEFLIFASGVSDSKLSGDKDFRREEQLLMDSVEINPSKKVVYFSTCSIEDPDLKNTAYIQHKIAMEQLIKEKAKNYFIFRLSNLAGRTNNPHTILNFFYFHIQSGETFQVWKNSERNIIDIDDVYLLSDYILKNNLFLNQTINIANTKNYPVIDIVKAIENICGSKASFTKIEKGARFSIDLTPVKPLYKLLNIEFEEDYLYRVLKKYYS